MKGLGASSKVVRHTKGPFRTISHKGPCDPANGACLLPGAHMGRTMNTRSSTARSALTIPPSQDMELPVDGGLGLPEKMHPLASIRERVQRALWRLGERASGTRGSKHPLPLAGGLACTLHTPPPLDPVNKDYVKDNVVRCNRNLVMSILDRWAPSHGVLTAPEWFPPRPNGYLDGSSIWVPCTRMCSRSVTLSLCRSV